MGIMKKSTAWILLSVLPLISSLPGPAKVGLEDLALEMVLCEELDGACNTLTEENLEPVVMKLEKAAEANELDFGENLYEELETRVGRLLCGLDYNQFCTEGGRSVLQEESWWIFWRLKSNCSRLCLVKVLKMVLVRQMKKLRAVVIVKLTEQLLQKMRVSLMLVEILNQQKTLVMKRVLEMKMVLARRTC